MVRPIVQHVAALTKRAACDVDSGKLELALTGA
jgi:hypothetical protein